MPADRATARGPAPPPRRASPTAKRDTAPARRAASPAGPPVLRLVPPAARREEGVEDLLKSPGPGVPLPEALRRRLEASLRVDLSSVRIHADKRAASVVDRLGARAFTFGRRIFLGGSELATDMTLMAHEAAHVVQQRGRPVVQKATETPSPAALEREADSASAAVQRREPAAVAGRTDGPAIQRQERLGTIEDGPAKEEEDEGWIESRIWSRLGSFGQELREISRKGIVGYLLDHIKNGLQALVDRLFEPVRPLLDAVAWVRAQFGTALDWMREAAAQIAKNDCSAVTKAVERIQEIANVILTAVKEKLEAATAKVKDFFTRLWDKFGAPSWETLKEIGGAIWERIQQLGAWIWEKTQPVRDWLARAWKWVKDKLGVGEGEEGQNGLLQWVQRKAGEAWDWLKPKIEPFKKPLLVAAGIALMFSPAGPFLAAGAGIAGFIKAVQLLRQTFGAKNGVVDQRSVLERTVLPALKGAADKVASGLKSAAGAVSERLGGIVGSLGEAAGSLAGSAVAFLSRAVEWVHAQVQSLASWANQQLSVLAERISDGLDRLKAFLQPVLDFLGEVGAVVKDILSLPAVIVGKLWKKIPACIRDPFVNFFIEQILKRIPLFKTVTETIPAIWGEIKATALLVIKKVFKEGDLKGAALEVLRLVLKALGIPLELFTGIFEKSGNLLDRIMDDPGKFLGNVLRALKDGVIGFGSRILQHLLGGLTDWLLSQLQEANVKPPEDFTLKGIFFFVLDVLGLSFEMVLGRLEKKSKPAAEAIRKTVKVLSEVWSWISTLLNEGPEGVWKRLKEKVSDLWGTLIASASQWIVKQVALKAIAKLATLAAAPVGTIIQGLILIYDTIRAIARYLKQMLEIISSVLDMGLDLAAGVVEGAAKLVESLLQKALGLAIGFLAQYAGLGGLGKKIAEIIGTIREKIVEAVDWLLDKAIAAMKGLVGLVKAGVGKILNWWKAKEPFNDGQGSHTVGFKGEGASAELVIESTPEILENYLKRTKIQDADKLKKIGKYKKEIDDIKERTKGGFGQEDGEKIQKALIEIAKLLGKKIPESEIDFKTTKVPGFKGEVGSVMTAGVLSLKSSQYAGSQPYEESGFWLDVNRREGTYVRGHLLNHHVHGPGFNKNLVPIPLSTNTQMEKTFESKVKDRVLSRAEVISYTVKAEFKRPTGRKYLPSEDLIPSTLVLSAEVLNSDFKSQKPPEYPFDNQKEVRFPVDLGPDDKVGFKREHVVLQDDPAEKIQTIPGIGPVLAERVVTYRKKNPFNFFDDLKNIERMPADIVDELKDDKFVTLYKRT